MVRKKKAYTATIRRDARSPVVILGSGWAGFQLARDLDKEKYDVTLISDRNHFLFTPLLPSTTVGTLEFRTIQEPVRTIPGITFYQGAVWREAGWERGGDKETDENKVRGTAQNAYL